MGEIPYPRWHKAVRQPDRSSHGVFTQDLTPTNGARCGAGQAWDRGALLYAFVRACTIAEIHILMNDPLEMLVAQNAIF